MIPAGVCWEQPAESVQVLIDAVMETHEVRLASAVRRSLFHTLWNLILKQRQEALLVLKLSLSSAPSRDRRRLLSSELGFRSF